MLISRVLLSTLRTGPLLGAAGNTKTVIRIPKDLHDKLRWLAYQERRSQHSIIMEIMEKALRAVQIPEEDKK